jgi:mono/diheme cytochrome c family protein
MKAGIPLCAAFALVAVSTAGAGEKKVDPKVLGAGRTLYLQYCASCHGADGKGGGEVAASLKTAPTDLTALTKDGQFEADRVRTSIDGTHAASAHGTREMPVWGKVLAKTGERRGEGWAATEIWTLVEYLRSIQAK